MAKFKVGDKIKDTFDTFEVIKVDVITATYDLKSNDGHIGTHPWTIVETLCQLINQPPHGGYVLKYKVGDRIRYNTGGEYEVVGYDNNVKNGKHMYVLRELNYPVLSTPTTFKEDYDFVEQMSNLIPIPGTYGSANNSVNSMYKTPLLTTPKFYKGQVVLNTKGSRIKITGVNLNIYEGIYLNCINDKTKDGQNLIESITFADVNWKLETYVDILPPSQVKQCTCSSRDIFLKGCTCGAVSKYKPKWG
jgi:hypothetical protein